MEGGGEGGEARVWREWCAGVRRVKHKTFEK